MNEIGFCAFSMSKKRSFSTAERAPSCLINRAALGGTHDDDARHFWLKQHIVSNSIVFFLPYTSQLCVCSCLGEQGKSLSALTGRIRLPLPVLAALILSSSHSFMEFCWSVWGCPMHVGHPPQSLRHCEMLSRLPNGAADSPQGTCSHPRHHLLLPRALLVPLLSLH